LTETIATALFLMHVEGVCVDKGPDKNTCENGTPTVIQNCNDGLYCNGIESCSNAECTAGTPVDCSDSLFCTVNERCDEAQDECVYDEMDCSSNNIPEIARCDNNPDNIPYTWDYRTAFTSTCDEEKEECTTGSNLITHTCDVEKCDAECDSTHGCEETDYDWKDGCVGNDYYDYSDVENSCNENCTCTHNACNSPTISYNDPRCTCAGDEDNDGINDCDDKCPGSKPGEPVDMDGCDPFQFCGRFYCGGCEHADFNNNEPGKEFPNDCTLVIIFDGKSYILKCVPTEVKNSQCFN
jgi:hypothetical protein